MLRHKSDLGFKFKAEREEGPLEETVKRIVRNRRRKQNTRQNKNKNKKCISSIEIKDRRRCVRYIGRTNLWVVIVFNKIVPSNHAAEVGFPNALEKASPSTIVGLLLKLVDFGEHNVMIGVSWN